MAKFQENPLFVSINSFFIIIIILFFSSSSFFFFTNFHLTEIFTDDSDYFYDYRIFLS